MQGAEEFGDKRGRGEDENGGAEQGVAQDLVYFRPDSPGDVPLLANGELR